MMNGQFPEAEKAAHELIEKEKSFSPIYDLLYLQYVRQNRMERCRTGAETQNREQSEKGQLFGAIGRTLPRSSPRVRYGRRDAAADQTKKIIPRAVLLAGDFFFFRAHEFEHAREQYETAIKAFPKDKNLYEKRLVELYATENKAPQANEAFGWDSEGQPQGHGRHRHARGAPVDHRQSAISTWRRMTCRRW